MTAPQLPPPVMYLRTPPKSGTAVAAMVCGIVGALGGWCMLGVPCLLAVLLGHIGLVETRTGERGGRGMAVTGLILGYPFAVLWVALGVAAITGSAFQ